MSNHLINETSPYLLQHAHNPVDWYPWGDEALERAKKEDKPILVSIGYSACHWCHVMERESFEDEATAALMNEHFVNIKIDREERPDLDHIYMDAVQAISGSGGWPLNVFLTPGGKPFYGGTYFPPKRAFNRASWQEVLQGVATAFKEQRKEILEQAENLSFHIERSNAFGQQHFSETQKAELFSAQTPAEIFKNIMKSADRQWGGFGNAPKFPQSFTIQYLLRYHWLTNNEEALKQALLSLDKMIEGGIYDQVGGGFARYSTDTEWLAPHFEKMLYDNALLVSVLSEAYQVTAENRYKNIISETIEFIQRELMHSDGGFYSALDADSEGEEGKFYVWKYGEVNELLKEDAEIFSAYYDISPSGNWEGKSIPRVLKSPELFAQEKGLSSDRLQEILSKGRSVLLKARETRIRPLLDDKILLGWNALMNTALCKAYGATGLEEYRELAVRNMAFLFSNLRAVDGPAFHHTWKNGKAKFPAFLDDYAYLIQSLIHLYEITAEQEWLLESKRLTEHVIENFSEEDTGYFLFTHKNQKDVILRKKEVYDGAVPSGNSVMASCLYHLSLVFDKPVWRERSEGITAALGNPVVQYPTSFGIWACHLLQIVAGTQEIALLGSSFKEALKEVMQYYIPHKILMSSDKADQGFPLLAGKASDVKISVYLCKNFSCLLPFSSVEQFKRHLERERQRFNLIAIQ